MKNMFLKKTRFCFSHTHKSREEKIHEILNWPFDSTANSHSQIIFIQFHCAHQTGPLKGQCMISKKISSPFLVKLLEQSIGTYFFIGISNFI